MKKRIELFLHRLSFKWVLITCVIVLPVNLLAAVTASLMNRSYRENMTDSYQSYLNHYCAQMEETMSAVENTLQVFLSSSNLVKLNVWHKDDSVVEVTRFKNQLTNSNAWLDYSGLCAIWDKEKDIVSFMTQGNKYNRTDYDYVEQTLRKAIFRETSASDWEWMTAGKKAFFVKFYDFKYFSFCILIDGGEVLREFRQSCATPDCTVWFADREGKLLASYSENGFLLEEGEENREALFSKNRIVLSGELGSDSYQLVQMVETEWIMRELPVLFRMIYILTIISFLILPAVYLIANHMVIKPLLRLVKAMGKLESGDLDYHMETAAGSTELDYLFESFNHMVDELNRLVISSYEREIERLQSDAVNMRLQVNQHMLLNFLNTIYSLSQVGKNEQIGEFSLLLMKYFRYVLRQDSALVSVKEELEFVQDYLKIQKVRFPNSFISVYSLEPEAEGILLPQLLIQNCVENSVKYGMVMGSEMEIIINIRVEEEKLIISVCDTGNGMEPEILEKLNSGEVVIDRNGKHIGIWNCRKRLKYYYGDSYVLRIISKPGAGTQTWIELPLEPLEKEKSAKAIHIRERGEGIG